MKSFELLLEITAVSLGFLAFISVIAAGVDASLIISILTPSPTVGTNVTAGVQKVHSAETKKAEFVWIRPPGTPGSSIARNFTKETTNVGGTDFENDSLVVDTAGTWNLTVRYLKQSNDEVVANFKLFEVTAPTCGITVSPSIDFGPLNPGTTSAENKTTITNTGNSNTTSLTIQGTNWSSGLDSMDATQTHWSTTIGQSYGSMNDLNLSPGESLGKNVGPSTPLDVFFKLLVPVNQPSGIYGQTITFTAGC